MVQQVVARRDLREDPANIGRVPRTPAGGGCRTRLDSIESEACLTGEVIARKVVAAGSRASRAGRGFSASLASVVPASAPADARRSQTCRATHPRPPEPPDADVVLWAQRGREEHSANWCARRAADLLDTSAWFAIAKRRRYRAQDTFIKVLNHIDRLSPEFRLSTGCSRSRTTLRSTTCGSGRSAPSASMGHRTRRRPRGRSDLVRRSRQTGIGARGAGSS